ncbi:hypothetical protein HYH03_001596 [Edaphochlamys debaryana]|uniref:Sec1 family domain-containing protein 2 n=1 Tax=Edaphochlamys debaryana TaxID=47281 RepID=A0A835YFK2_9CHLO|nr:hypothetical protein HYH03_001596 [Edaphochlamys debaryana]|eukprot:KAG2500834.1 hypothetical protein HYH03_001596 [Edaphochlamys debaryana]
MLEVIQRPVLEVAESLQGVLLYLDAGAGEIAQTTLGLPFLLGLGVSHVCSLELASSEDGAYPQLSTGSPPTRLAIFTTQLLTDVHPHVLKAVLAHPHVSHVSVFCSVSEHAHACQAATALGVEAYREYAELLREQVYRARGSQHAAGSHPRGPSGGGAAGTGGPGGADGGGSPLSVRVSFLPLLASCLDAGCFVLPAGAAAARRAVAGGLAAGLGPADAPGSDAAAEGEGGSGGLSLAAHALLALSAAMGVARPEPFPIGPVSALIAAELASLPSLPVSPAAAAAATPSAAGGAPSLALVLIDRSLDAAMPALHSDHPWEAVLGEAARRQAAAAVEAAGAGAGMGTEGPKARRGQAGAAAQGSAQVLWRPLDLRVGLPGAEPVPLDLPWREAPPAASSASASSSDPLSYNQLSYDQYGVDLLDPADRTAVARVEAVAGKPRKDALAALRRALKEALRAEKLAPAVRSKAGAVTAAELRGLAEGLLAAPGAGVRQRSVAALGLAVAEALGGPAAEAAEAAAGLGRSVLAALAGGSGADGGGGDAAAQVLLDALAAARHGHSLLHVGHVLDVLPAVYSAAPDSHPQSDSASTAGAAAAAPPNCPFSPPQAAEVQRALQEAVLECPAPLEQLAGRLPSDLVAALAARRGQLAAATAAAPSEEAVRRRCGAALDGLTSSLSYLAGARGRMRDLKKVTHLDVFAENHGAVNAIVRQVVRRVLQRAELSDWQLQAQPAGGGLVRGLLGGLMGASRALVGAGRGGGAGPHPADFGTVIVFVVGGLSPAEVREARAEVEEHVGSKPRVVLGGTSLLLPQDLVFQLSSRQTA